MAKGLTKAQIADHLAQKTELSKKQVLHVLEELAQLAYGEAKNGFTVPGFGKLVVVDRPARMGRNPRTGEQIQIPAKRAVKFRLSKEAKDGVAANS
jgi:DNA-binding protein HU-beta